MYRRKQPFQLKTLAMAAVGSNIKYVFHLCEDQGHMWVRKMLSDVSVTLFSSVPCELSDEMAAAALKFLMKLIEVPHAKYGVFSHPSVLSTLTVTITTLNMKCCKIWSWPIIMHYFLCKNLCRLKGLEELHISSGSYCMNVTDWNTSEAEKNIVRAMCSMAHLKALYLSLVCTDQILKAVGDTCHSLQILDVMFSRFVTDQSISALLCCSQLQKIILYKTSITARGIKNLLGGLPKLQDIGQFHEFKNVLQLLSQEPNTRFHNLRKLVVGCDMTDNNLQLLVRLFPLLSCLELTRSHRGADLVILSAVHNLTELTLENYYFIADHIDDLLQLSGPKLTLLKLSGIQIDLNGLVFISQHCPHLVTFSLACQLLDHAGPHNASPNEPAFPCLEHLNLYLHGNSHVLKHRMFLLSNCCNIRFIELDVDVNLTDAMMSAVFTRNQMKQLEELRILNNSNISMKTVQLLMQHCDRLKFISEFRCWDGVSSQELAGLRNYIRENNLDLHLA